MRFFRAWTSFLLLNTHSTRTKLEGSRRLEDVLNIPTLDKLSDSPDVVFEADTK